MRNGPCSSSGSTTRSRSNQAGVVRRVDPPVASSSNIAMTSPESPPSQPPADRRRRRLPWWHPRRLRGRRMRNDFSEKAGQPYLVERVSGGTFAAAALVLVLTIADGVITVLLLDRGCEEANPLMRYLL